MSQSLFGIPVPQGAVRAIVRPVLGRGPTLPCYDGEVDSALSDLDIVQAVSRNQDFWHYVDAAVQAGRIKAQEGCWLWKVKVEFRDQTGVGPEISTSEEVVEFYRVPTNQGTEAPYVFLEKASLFLDKMHARYVELHKAGMQVLTTIQGAHADGLKAMAQAHAESIKGIAQAHAEALKASSEPLARLTDKLHEETIELKTGIFELQTKLSQQQQAPAQAPKTAAQEIKEFTSTVVALKEGLSTVANAFDSTSAPSAPDKPSAPTPSAKPGTKGEQ